MNSLTQMPFIEIPLHGVNGTGKHTLVDGDYDGEYFSQYKWYLLKNGYVGRDGKREGVNGYIYLHREVQKVSTGLYVDHINGNRLDNRSCNLRPVTSQQSAWNRGTKKGQKTGYKGVAKNTRGGRFVASIQGTYIGTYSTAIEAAKAYDLKSKKIYGIHARTNLVK